MFRKGICFLLIALLLTAFLMTACDRSVSTGTAVGIGGTGYLDVEMWASSNCVQAGDTVHLRATVTNRSDKNWTVELEDQPVFDIQSSSEGKRVHWSDGKPLSELSHLELKPGESRTLEMDVVAPKNQNYGFIGAIARFVYSSRAAGGPARPGVMINIGSSCPGLIGP